MPPRLRLSSYTRETYAGETHSSGASRYMSDPGVVSVSPVSSGVFRPDRTIGQPP